jgi:hypothetical protein
MPFASTTKPAGAFSTVETARRAFFILENAMNALDGPQAGESCLSIRQPWAQLILSGRKTVENRKRATRFRGRLWLHAPQPMTVRRWSELSIDPIGLPALSALVRGAIIGSVEVYDCRRFWDMSDEQINDSFATGPYCWLLREPQILRSPVVCKGRLGIWTYR